jgi:hypothetical protein
VFLKLWDLYTSCRRSRTWARLELETSNNGEETFIFTSKKPSRCEPSPTPPRQPSATPSPRRKSPSKARKDKAKWRAWLTKKLADSGEEMPSPAVQNLVTPGEARIVPVCGEEETAEPGRSAATTHPSTHIRTQGDQQIFPSAPSLPPSTMSSVEDYTGSEEYNTEDCYAAAMRNILRVPDDPDPIITTTADGETLTRLLPVNTEYDEHEYTDPNPFREMKRCTCARRYRECQFTEHRYEYKNRMTRFHYFSCPLAKIKNLFLDQLFL